MIYDIQVSNALSFSQTVKVPVTYIQVNSVLTWNQLVAKNIRTRVSGSSLLFSQAVSFHKTINKISIGNTLTLTQDGRPTPISLTLIQTLFQWQNAYRNLGGNVSNQLSLSQVVADSNSKGTNATVAFTQSVAVKIVRNIAVVTQYAAVSNAAITSSAGVALIINPTTIVPQSKVTFTFGAFTFQVRKPDFDNSTKLEFSRINRRSRGGDLIIYRDPMWPESITLMMSFSLLSPTDKDNFKRLFKVSLGELVRYDDYLGQSWSGIILNPGEPIVQYGLGDRFTTKVELQGSRI